MAAASAPRAARVADRGFHDTSGAKANPGLAARRGGHAAGIESRALAHEALALLAYGDVTAQVVPGRGGIVSALAVGGRDALFLDRATLEDPAKNVRGGIPILFPFAGKLEDERFRPAGTRMKQHGFGRNQPWAVREQRADAVRLGPSSRTSRREPNIRTRTTSSTACSSSLRGLLVELLVHNRGPQPLPVSPGWHPYFRCPAAAKAQITAATCPDCAPRNSSRTTGSSISESRPPSPDVPASTCPASAA
mgnify:CR=1 FL=1